MRNRLMEQILEKMQYLKRQDLDLLRNVLITVLNDYEVHSAKNEIAEFDVSSNYTLLGMYLVAKKVEGCTDKTIEQYKRNDTKFLDNVNKPLINITTDDIRYYLANRSIKNKIEKSTQDNELRYLKSFFGWLTTEEYIPKNPTLKIKAIKKEKKIKQPYSELEFEQLHTACDTKRETAIVDVLYSTGCRVSELVRMDKADIHGDEIIVFGKGEKERVVYLNARAINSLNEYLKERTDDNEALFVSMNRPHGRLGVRSIEKTLNKLGKKCCINKSHPHKMRGTTATRALERGMPSEELREVLGHADIRTTLLYARVSSAAVKCDHKKYVV